MKIRKRLAAAVLAVLLAVAAVPCAVMAEKKEEKLIKVTLVLLKDMELNVLEYIKLHIRITLEMLIML